MISNTKIQELTRLIERSVLLTKKRKKELLKALPSLSKAYEQELLTLLQSESDIIEDIARQAIERAVEEEDEKFLNDLDAFLRSSIKGLRKAEERAERWEEEESLEHFFDDTA